MPKLLPYGLLGFIGLCMAKGFSQPTAKAILISTAKEIGHEENISLTGNVQSMVTVANSGLELIANILIFYMLPYPYGAYVFLLLVSGVSAFIFYQLKILNKNVSV